MIPNACAITRYRPTKIADGEGGFTETLGTGLTIFGAWRIHENHVASTVDNSEDVLVSDILLSDDGAKYRVELATQIPGTSWMQLSLSRLERPIQP